MVLIEFWKNKKHAENEMISMNTKLDSMFFAKQYIQ